MCWVECSAFFHVGFVCLCKITILGAKEGAVRRVSASQIGISERSSNEDAVEVGAIKDEMRTHDAKEVNLPGKNGVRKGKLYVLFFTTFIFIRFHFLILHFLSFSFFFLYLLRYFSYVTS